MTPDDLRALARRAVACKGWRLMRGMRLLLSDGGTTLITHETNPNGWVSATRGFFSPEPWAALGALPDLEDPATLGCLLALVREAHGRRCYTQAVGGYWTVQNGDTEDEWGGHCAIEIEALVAALEAAP